MSVWKNAVGVGLGITIGVWGVQLTTMAYQWAYLTFFAR